MLAVLERPEVQSAVAPLVLSLLAGWGLFRWAPRYAGWAVVLGFVTTALLVNGLEFVPLTGARKIMLVVVLAAVAGIVLDRVQAPGQRRAALLGLMLVAYFWIAYRVLANTQGVALGLAIAGGVLYLAWLVLALDRMRENSAAALAVSLALAMGTSIISILGASALLGQLSAGLAAGAGALWLLTWRYSDFRFNLDLGLAVALGTGLLGLGAVLFAQLPWHALAVLALAPLVSLLPGVCRLPGWQQRVAYLLAALIVAGSAVAWVWSTLEDSSGLY